MAYDASEVVRALERPSLIVERDRWWHYLFGIRKALGETKTYTGRILSHPEFVPLFNRWTAMDEEDHESTETEVRELVIDTCKAMGMPSKVMLRLPGAALRGALEDFWVVQLKANGLVALDVENQTSPSPPGNGSRSGSRGRMTSPSK